MKDLWISLGYLVGAGEVLLAWYFWKTHSGDAIRKSMALLAFSTAGWVIATTVGMYVEAGARADFAVAATYAFGVLMVTSVVIFAFLYPLPTTRVDRWHILFLLFPVAIFTTLLFGTHEIVGQYIVSPTFQGKWIGGPMYHLYNVYLIVLYCISIIVLSTKIRRTDGSTRHNATLVFWSLILGGLPGVVSDLFVPLFTNTAYVPALGTLSTVFWLGITSYIVLKK